MSNKKVLIVDDSLYMRTIIKEALSNNGYQVIGEAVNGESAIDMAIELKPDLITLDNILPDMLGLDILRTLKDEGLLSKVIIISAVGQRSVVEEGIKLGADDYIIKPFTTEKLIEVANRVYKNN
ncbi:MAG: response regulator [Microscillaceae bacterium]|nr:response regulator [Microscillaceae bacterium]